MKLNSAALRLLLIIGITSVVFIVAGVVYNPAEGILPYILGVILGSGINALRVVMLNRTVDRAVDMQQDNAKNYIRIQYLLRSLLTAAVLIIAALTPYIGLLGAALGMLTWPVSTLAMRLFKGKNGEGEQ